MEFTPIKTKSLNPPKDDLFKIIDEYITEVKNGDIIFITSKVVSIHQGRCIKNDGNILKKDLIEKETNNFIKTNIVPGKEIYLTITDNILIPTAGIDESNANGYFILWPKNLNDFCKKVHSFLCKKFNIKDLGIIITDSSSKPLRWGVVGIGIYSYGFKPLLDKRGEKDIFGKELIITQINLIDAISAMGVFVMGEGSENTPIVIGRNIPNIVYDLTDNLYENILIKPENDLYRDLLSPIFKK